MQKGEIEIYKTSSGTEIQVNLNEEIIWLTQSQIAFLFDVQRPAITKHLNNIFKSGELNEKMVGSILEQTTQEGKTQTTKVKY